MPLDLNIVKPFESLSQHYQNQILRWLNAKYAKARTGDHFDVGKTVGGCWTVTSALAGANGCFNRGIFVVKDERDKLNSSKAILKLLPTQAMHPEFARCEIDILAALKHDNIVESIDSAEPEHPHEMHWIVIEYCDHQTLGNLLSSYMQKKTMLPELFLWQVFESLAHAVHYCHHGDTGSKYWDGISHRDITARNVFIKSGAANHTDAYPFTLKLGDFGCGIAKSEWNDKTCHPIELPLVDLVVKPPETALPTEATNVYEIGVVMACFYGFTHLPPLRMSLENSQSRPGCDQYPRHFGV